MKELTIEEKAKRYDEAIEVTQRFYNNSVAITKKGLEDIFPELKESEDERIRKEIIDFATKANNGVTSILANNYDFNKWIAFLEKQGEKKPTKWSEEDEKNIDFLIHLIEHNVPNHSFAFGDGCAYGCKSKEEAINMLKDLKDRVQPKQEWSEEDKSILFCTISDLKFLRDTISTDPNYAVNISDTEREITWLKSLKNKVQPKQEWSEEDKDIKETIIGELELVKKSVGEINYNGYDKLIDWLKSLSPQNKQEWVGATKEQIDTIAQHLENIGNTAMAEILYGLHPQNTWKPSDEQIRELSIVSTGKGWFSKEILSELLEQLKKLREK